MVVVSRITFCLFIYLLASGQTSNSPAPVTSLQKDTACDHEPTTFRCVKYLKNYDADTMTVEISNVHPLLGEKVSVRVLGIDTPEMKGKLPCEKEAAKKAQQLIEDLLKNAKVINLQNVGRDKYFRILADVEVDGKMMKDLLLEANLAYEYHGATKQKIDWCRFTKTKS